MPNEQPVGAGTNDAGARDAYWTELERLAAALLPRIRSVGANAHRIAGIEPTLDSFELENALNTARRALSRLERRIDQALHGR